MPTPRRSGEVKRISASLPVRRLPSTTLSPMGLKARSEILPRSTEISALTASALEASDGEGGVVPTEAKTVAENSVDIPLDADVGCVVEIELGIRLVVVDG